MDDHQNNRVDKFFRDSLQFYQDKSSRNLWAKIESNLNRSDRLAQIVRIRRRILVAATLILIMTGTGIYLYQSPHARKTLPGQPNKMDVNHPVTTAKIQQLNQSTSVNTQVLIKHAIIQNNNSLTRIGIPYLQSWNPDMTLLKDTTEYVWHHAALQTPKSGILLIETDRANALPQPASTEKMVVKPVSERSLNKLSITAFFSQEFAGYNLSDNDATAADGKEIEQRERNAFSASMGLYLNYRVNKRWTIQSGLDYSWSTSDIDSSKSFAVKNNSGAVQFKMNTISGYGYLQIPPSILPTVGDSILTGKTTSRIHYLTLPLVLSYRIPMKRFSLLVGAGISFNLLTKAYLETQIYGPNLMGEETATPIKGLKNLYYGFILKADLEYQINNRLGVNLIPAFKNSLSPINIHSALSAYPYNFGLGVGMSYHF